MNLHNGNLIKLTVILGITSSLSIANIKSDIKNAPKLATVDNFNPTAFTNKPKEKIKKSSVLKAQRLLKSKGFLNSKPDGIIGFDTKQAVKAYQIEKKLDVTGVLNKETLNAMNLDWSKSNKTY
jgi:peptidoglycan hydrolase-like protein with peptidoglycan-binding domain